MNIFSRLLGRGPKPPPIATATPIDTLSVNAIHSAASVSNLPRYAPYKSPGEMLENACQKGDLVTVKRIITDTVNGQQNYYLNKRIDNSNHDGFTPLIVASINRQIPVVKLLLRYGADVNMGDNEKQTPLYWASNNGDAELVEILLDNNAVVAGDRSMEETNSPLYIAIEKGHTPIVKLLLDKGNGVNVNQKINNSTPLFQASNNGDAETVELLIEKGADVNNSTRSTDTALSTASWKGNASVVKILLENGANVNAVNEKAKQPLSEAIYGVQYSSRMINADHVSVVKILLENGANVNAVNEITRQSPLSIAVRDAANADEEKKSKYAEIVKILLNNGASINGIRAKNFDSQSKAINDILQRWPATMWLTALQELFVYNQVDAESMKDLDEYMGPKGGRKRKTTKRKKSNKRRKTNKRR